MRVIVTGSRGWKDNRLIRERLADLPGNATVVHGNARGVDQIANLEAQLLGLEVETHDAEWEKHGETTDLVRCWCPPESNYCKAAGIRRNEKMAALGGDLCIAFWDGSSRGTQDMMERAAKYGIPIEVIHMHYPIRPLRSQI